MVISFIFLGYNTMVYTFLLQISIYSLMQLSKKNDMPFDDRVTGFFHFEQYPVLNTC